MLERPPEAPCPVFIASLKDQQNGANLEEGGADKGCPSAAHVCLAAEGRFGKRDGQPGEEAADNKDEASDGEEHSDKVGYVPVGASSEHAPDTNQDGAW